MAIALIEDKKPVESLEEILKVNRVDVVMPGTGALSCSYGMCGQVDHPVINVAEDRVIAPTALIPGKTVGMTFWTVEEARH